MISVLCYRNKNNSVIKVKFVPNMVINLNYFGLTIIIQTPNEYTK